MIQRIEKEKKLKKVLSRTIEDEGIKIEVDSKLRFSEYVGIKVDDYYNGLHDAAPPKSVDFVVAVDCECDWYTLYILELKNVKRTTKAKDIQEKFDTAINQFMKKDFSDIFMQDRFKYKDIKLYLVTTSYKKAEQYGCFEKYQNIRKRIKERDTLYSDSLLSQKPYEFRGRYYRIEREIPPNPIIKKIL